MLTEIRACVRSDLLILWTVLGTGVGSAGQHLRAEAVGSANRHHDTLSRGIVKALFRGCRCSKIMSPLNCNETLSPSKDGDTTVTEDRSLNLLLCHVAFNAPLRTRRERAETLRQEKKDFLEQYGPEAREVLAEMVENFAVNVVLRLVNDERRSRLVQ
jgi:hypothetical protein